MKDFISALRSDDSVHAKASDVLQYGSRGPMVKQLQEELRLAGVLDAYLPGETTTYFGHGTRAAVEDFQRAKKLPVDGVVGPLTRAALKRAIAKA